MSDNENKKIQSLTPKEIVAELDKYIIEIGRAHV